MSAPVAAAGDGPRGRKGRRIEVYRPSPVLDVLMTGIFLAEVAWAVAANGEVRVPADGGDGLRRRRCS